MKKFYSTLLPFILLANTAFATDIRSTTYNGKSHIELTHYGSEWKKSNECRNMILVLAVSVASVGIAIPKIIDDCFNPNAMKRSLIEAKFTVHLNELANGRANLELSSSPMKGCAGFSNMFLGEDNGFGGYKLYSTEENYSEGASIGHATLQEDGLKLTFMPGPAHAGTKGSNGSLCLWQLGTNFNVFLARSKKPQKNYEFEQRIQ